MSDNNSAVLDFDDVKPVHVRLAGRTFSLIPQSAKAVQSVLEYASVDEQRTIATEDEDKEGQGKDPRRFVRDVFSTWDDTVAATALMLGVGPETKDYQADLTFLKEHLSPRIVIKIYERWWEVNEVDAFFARGGRVLMPVSYLERLQEFRERLAERAVEEIMVEDAAVSTVN